MSIAAALDPTSLAVITGGASGIGFNMAERCAAAGMDLAILDISEKELEEVSLESGCVRLNLSDFDLYVNVRARRSCRAAK